MRCPITTHVLDTTLGKPGEGVRVMLEIQAGINQWKELGSGRTNSDGRIADLVHAGHQIERGLYRITFDTASYFRLLGVNSFYPYVQIVFEIRDPGAHYHVPLLLSPFGYSTCRGG
jgi:5-hydroxyisourate hydrolase